MKKDLTEMVFILDKSGSMAGLESDTVGGFNSMIKKQQKQDGEAFVTTILFSSSSEMVHDRVSLTEIKPMTEHDYTVGGCTALIDAIGDAIVHISNIHKYARPIDVPEHTIFVIMTDGYENASHKFSSHTVKKLIEQKKHIGWEFLFLGANIDAVETAKHFGIARERAATFRNDSEGQQLNYDCVSDAVRSMRSCGNISDDWSKPIKKRGDSDNN